MRRTCRLGASQLPGRSLEPPSNVRPRGMTVLPLFRCTARQGRGCCERAADRIRLTGPAAKAISCAVAMRQVAAKCPTSTRLRGCVLGLVAVLLVTAAHAEPAGKIAKAKLLVVSDIHFNPMADPTLVAELEAADPSQWESILQRSTPAKFSPYGQDSNWWLVQSALDAMARTEPHPALILFDGDLLAHSFPKNFTSSTHDSDPAHYRAFVLKTVDFMAAELRKRFPDTRILLTPGNNDDDCGDYNIEANGAFLNDTAERARELAGEGESVCCKLEGLGQLQREAPDAARCTHSLAQHDFLVEQVPCRQLRKRLCDGQFHRRQRSACLAGIAAG